MVVVEANTQPTKAVDATKLVNRNLDRPIAMATYCFSAGWSSRFKETGVSAVVVVTTADSCSAGFKRYTGPVSVAPLEATKLSESSCEANAVGDGKQGINV